MVVVYYVHHNILFQGYWSLNTHYMVYRDSENISVGNQGWSMEEAECVLDLEEWADYWEEASTGQNTSNSTIGADVEAQVDLRCPVNLLNQDSGME